MEWIPSSVYLIGDTGEYMKTKRTREKEILNCQYLFSMKHIIQFLSLR